MAHLLVTRRVALSEPDYDVGAEEVLEATCSQADSMDAI
jgi:hypothetical protein